ncbi:hypothetical protein LTS18_001236, partial [Coniosporium uncinatum]
QLKKRSDALVSAASAVLTKLDAKVGVNAAENNGAVWFGNDGQYTMDLENHSGEDIVLVVWGTAGSWINAVQPQISTTLPNGTMTTLSFADGVSGAFSAIYEDTTMVNGQVSNTWGEFTMGEYGVIDVSREVNMSGHRMQVNLPKCKTNMDTCVFVCPDANTCMTGYQLQNCDNGSQEGATSGTYAGAPSGGCGGMGSSAHFTAHFGE